MEKHKCQRFPVILPTVFSGERAGGGVVVDVSLEGSGIQSAVPMQKGDYVRIRIEASHGQSLSGPSSDNGLGSKMDFVILIVRLTAGERHSLLLSGRVKLL